MESSLLTNKRLPRTYQRSHPLATKTFLGIVMTRHNFNPTSKSKQAPGKPRQINWVILSSQLKSMTTHQRLLLQERSRPSLKFFSKLGNLNDKSLRRKWQIKLKLKSLIYFRLSLRLELTWQ